MYELWLMANIGWELLLMYRVPVAIVAIACAALWALAARRPARGGGRAVAIAAGAAFVAALVVVPMLARSSITEARYAPDWLAVIGIAAAVAVVVAAFVAPLRRLASR